MTVCKMMLGNIKVTKMTVCKMMVDKNDSIQNDGR